MQTHNLSLEDARAVLEAAILFAQEQKLRPLGIAVMDHSGELLCLVRQDGAPPLRGKIATGKARAVWAVGQTTRELENVAMERPHFFTALTSLMQEGIVPTAGGLPIRREEGGVIIGSIGISGDTSDRDEECGLHALMNCGFA